MANSRTVRRVLPGFGLTLGYTMVYLCLLVLIPLSAVFVRSFSSGWLHFWEVVTSPRVLASLRLSFGASLLAALLNSVFGLIVAWVLVRYTFPCKRLVDALVDLPFALPTAVAGIALTALYAPNGWIGAWLKSFGISVAFTPLGIVVALTFIGLPFVVRTLQPVLEDLDREVEQAAASLGASALQAFTRVILPTLWPALLTGFALAFARAVGEYGSVIFIAGNMPMKSEIAPLLIVTKLEQYDYARRLRHCGGDAGAVVRFDACHQRLAKLGCDASRRASMSRILLIATALLFLGVFLVMPLLAVFAQALSKGLMVYATAITEPMAWAAVKLTLLVAAIAVPLNLIFGTAASWAIAKFEFRGKSTLTTLIDLPFAVSPVIAGLIFILIFGAHGWFGGYLRAHHIRVVFAVPGIVLATVFVTFPFIARELIPVMQSQGNDDEETALSSQRHGLAGVLAGDAAEHSMGFVVRNIAV